MTEIHIRNMQVHSLCRWFGDKSIVDVRNCLRKMYDSMYSATYEATTPRVDGYLARCSNNHQTNPAPMLEDYFPDNFAYFSQLHLQPEYLSCALNYIK